jgi:peptidoglycan/LPS O-acetylase OafA/YrhL
MQQIQSRNNNYDLLRVVAALCIMFTHSFDLLGQNRKETLMVFSNQKLNFAHIGLAIFFAVSGYLIAKSADTSSSFKNYIWKRFLRIQPLLIIVSIISIFIMGPIFTTSSLAAYFADFHTYTYLRNVMPLFGIQFILPNVFSTNIGDPGVNGSMWTLIVEERLYLIIGLLFLHKVHFKKILVAGIIILNILFFLNSVFYDGYLIPYFNGSNVSYALIFLNASLFYLVQVSFSTIKLKALVSLLLFSILYFTSFSIFKSSVQTILIPFLVIVLAEIKGFTNNAAKYGDITYGLYIFSFPVQQMLIASKFCISPFTLFSTTLLIVVPLAFLSWHFIEKKLLSLKEKLQ